MKNQCFYLCILICGFSLYAENGLSIREDAQYGRVVNGYINKATLVVEPHGAYAENSLYLEYSDHGGLGSTIKGEIVHRFTLPAGATVNDMWLWIGDSVMKADIMDTWTARHMYDSITSFHIDPAIIQVKNGQYELHVYPLISGSYRKIKLNYVVPTQYIGKSSFVQLPVEMLQADNNSSRPLTVRYRTEDTCFSSPMLLEIPSQKFHSLPDTLNMHYQELIVSDVKTMPSASLAFSMDFMNGYFFRSAKTDSLLYYTFGMYQNEYFGKELIQQKKKKRIIGIDLSGKFDFNSSKFLENLFLFLRSYASSGDSVRLILTGEGAVDTFPSQGWTVISDSSASSFCSLIKNGNVFSAKERWKKPTILFADQGGDVNNAFDQWSFPGLENLVTINRATDLHSAISQFSSNNIVAAYAHGSEQLLSDQDAKDVIQGLDAYFDQGGTFLTFIDYNRTEEKIVHHYIKNFQVTSSNNRQGLMTSNRSGNIGWGFPATFNHNCANPLIYNDSDAVVEVSNQDGIPVVITKKIGKGLLIVSGLYQFTDDKSIKRLTCTPLLNLHQFASNFEFPKIAKYIVDKYASSQCDDIFIISSAATYIDNSNTSQYESEIHLTALKEVCPIKIFSTLPDPNGSYASATYSAANRTFYGSGFLFNKVCELTKGQFLGSDSYTLDNLTFLGKPSYPMMDSFNLAVTADNNAIKLPYYSLSDMKSNTDKPLFFIGTIHSPQSLMFDFNIRYHGKDSVCHNSTTVNMSQSPKLSANVLQTMYAQKRLELMFAETPIDTAGIIALAIANRLLNDFTAFMAFEPDAKHVFLKNAFDESKYRVTMTKYKKPLLKDTDFLFQLLQNITELHFEFCSKISGDVNIRLFNLKGRVVWGKGLHVSALSRTQLITDKTKLPAGTYIAVAKLSPDQENKSSLVKIVKFSIP